MARRRSAWRWWPAAALLVWIAGIAWIVRAGLVEAERLQDRTLLAAAQVVAMDLGTGRGGAPAEALEMLRIDEPHVFLCRVLDLDTRRTIAGHADLPMPGKTLRAAPVYQDAEVAATPVRIVTLWRTVLLAGVPRDVLVQVAESTGPRRALAGRIAVAAMVTPVLTLGLAVAWIPVGVRRRLGPLRRLREQVRAGLDPATVDASAMPSDVAPLLDVISAQAVRQRQLGEAQARFVADASHQLKAPLTVLRAQAEHAMRQTEVGAMRTVVARLHDTTGTTGRLVAQLLALARSEPGVRLAHDRVDLDTLAQEATLELAALARAREIDLGYEGDLQVAVRGEALMLRELVINLVHNAVSYTPPGGTVTVSVMRLGSRPLLRVIDDGPGIPPAERRHVLQRFYRIPGSASEGSGLGLAIAAEICARHAIELTLKDVPGGGPGLCVDLTWPGAEAGRVDPPGRGVSRRLAV